MGIASVPVCTVLGAVYNIVPTLPYRANKQSNSRTGLSDEVMIVGDVNTCGTLYPQRAEPAGIELEEYLASTERIYLNQDNVPTRTNPSSGPRVE